MAVIFERTVERLKHLLFSEVTEQERMELEDKLRNEHGGEAYRYLKEEGVIGRRLAEYETWDEQRAFRCFVGRVSGRKRQLLRWMWSGVAAGVACVVGMLLLMRNGGFDVNESPEKIVRVENEVIVPGKVKARLKLASGEVVQVADDSIRIAGSTGGQITYIDGQLEYRTAREAKDVAYNELEVPVGGECHVLLEDGTRVWINAASSLKYPEQFVGGERRVYLVGEAYFEVAKAGKPFIVHTEWGEIRVLGTVFNVKAYAEEEEMQTTLVEGKVRVSDKEGEVGVELTAGEQAVSVDGRISKRQVDVEEYVGWQKGIYVFKRQKLGDIMRDLERWYGVSVFFQNPELRDVGFTGNLKRYENINAFMDILQRTGDIKYSIKNNSVIIYK